MYRYELHCHTSDVSRCAKATAEEAAECYANRGYDGIFTTDHFITGDDRYADMTWEERIAWFASGYEKAKEAGAKLGLKVFFAFEYTYVEWGGTDFLVYGLSPEWLLGHPEIQTMRPKDTLKLFSDSGAFITHAHPYRDSWYIECIRLIPSCIDGVEVKNANRTDVENKAAELYAGLYDKIAVAGSDNHLAAKQNRFCGIDSKSEICSPRDLITVLRAGDFEIFDVSADI